MDIERMHGFPILTADHWQEQLAELGIEPWPRIGQAMSPAEWLVLSNRSDGEKAGERFIPKTEIIRLRDPNGSVFAGARLGAYPSAAMVFTLIRDEFTLVVAEYKHGIESLTFQPPGGKMIPGEDYAACARREFAEETGFAIKELHPLTDEPIVEDPRLSSASVQWFFARMHDPPERANTPRGQEFVTPVIWRLSEWLKYLGRGGKAVDKSPLGITMCALHKMRQDSR